VRINDPRDILLAPVISEKSYSLLDENKYTFIVSPDANKTQTWLVARKEARGQPFVFPFFVFIRGKKFQYYFSLTSWVCLSPSYIF
jgi:hypothetical protein